MDKRKIIQNKNKYFILLAIAGVVIVIYILYAIINLIKSPTDVFMIEYGKVSMEEQAVGYLIREEVVVKGENYENGLIQIKSEGEKIAKGESFFKYSNTTEDEISNQIKEINSKIDEVLENQGDVVLAEIKSLDKQIEQKIENINSYTDVQKIQEYKNDINTYLSKKSKIIGEKSEPGSTLKQLYNQKNEYEARLTQYAEYVKAPMSGIASYRVDNLESTLTTSDFSKINIELLSSIKMKTGQIIATNNQEGKIINNFVCYIATIMDSDNAANCKVGQELKIRLSGKDEVKATVAYKAEENGKYIIIFKITSKVEDLVSYRKISIDVIWWSDTGLKVPNSSIIYDDNNQAYIIRNRAGYLDKIMVKKLRETKSYTLVRNYETEELKAMGYSSEDIVNMKNVSMYDEIMSKPTRQMLQ